MRPQSRYPDGLRILVRLPKNDDVGTFGPVDHLVPRVRGTEHLVSHGDGPVASFRPPHLVLVLRLSKIQLQGHFALPGWLGFGPHGPNPKVSAAQACYVPHVCL